MYNFQIHDSNLQPYLTKKTKFDLKLMFEKVNFKLNQNDFIS